MLEDGKEFTFREAMITSLVRAYITGKNHSELIRVRLSDLMIKRQA
jgi:hypothetical protein